MGERKVQCKYFPPDFDPKLLPKRHNFKDEQIKVRVMLPFTVCCSCCGEFIYRGTKFTSRKEDVDNEDYLGLRIFRFYIKCPNCLQEIVFKTDPKNSDYALEVGGTRNYEPWKQNEEIENLMKTERDRDEKGDAMKALENRTLECKREMDIHDGLEEIVDRNSRTVGINIDELLAQRREEDVNKIQDKRRAEEREDYEASVAFATSKSEVLIRIDADDSEPLTASTGFGFASLTDAVPIPAAKPLANGMLMVRKKKPEKDKEAKKEKKKHKKSRGE